MNIRYRITLTSEERDQLRAFVLAGKGAFRRLKRAQVLLAAEAGSTDAVIAANISVGTSTVFRTKRRFVEEGLEAALREMPRPGADRKLAEKEEALLVATACSKPPAGNARWTLALLAGEMVRLTKHRSISSETVRRRLAENELKPWLKKMWCIPKVDSEFVARMEDVLDLYAETPNERRHPTLVEARHDAAEKSAVGSVNFNCTVRRTFSSPVLIEWILISFQGLAEFVPGIDAKNPQRGRL